VALPEAARVTFVSPSDCAVPVDGLSEAVRKAGTGVGSVALYRMKPTSGGAVAFSTASRLRLPPHA
jgi:hypothetical protein